MEGGKWGEWGSEWGQLTISERGLWGDWDVKRNHFCLSKKVICLISVITGFVSRCWLTRYVCVCCHCTGVPLWLCVPLWHWCVTHIMWIAPLCYCPELGCAVQRELFRIPFSSTFAWKVLWRQDNYVFVLLWEVTSCYETWDSIDIWNPGVL